MTIDALVDWVKANPGRFTYPVAGCFPTPNCSYDEAGSAFIRHFLYYYPTTDSYKDMLGTFSQDIYVKHAPQAFTKLLEIAPYLYNVSGTTYYPATIVESDALFAAGKTWLTFSYFPSHAGQLVAAGYWPNTTTSYVLSSGTIANTSFLGIGVNAKNKLAALVVANYISSAPAMFNRRQPDVWGAAQCYNPSASFLTSGGWQVAFDYLETFPQTPSTVELRAAAMTEVSAIYATKMQNDWLSCVKFRASCYGITVRTN
jgi:putative spermidine/putrescine transport system substrate-binding protein